MPGPYKIKKGIKPPALKPDRHEVLKGLVALADQMEIGDAVELTMTEAQQMRIVLTAKGFKCATDGWRADDRTKSLVFKLAYEPTREELLAKGYTWVECKTCRNTGIVMPLKDCPDCKGEGGVFEPPAVPLDTHT